MSITVGLQKYELSISVGVRGIEVLATTQTSDVKPGHGTKALIWGMTWEEEKKATRGSPEVSSSKVIQSLYK